MADKQLMGIDLATENLGSAVGLQQKCHNVKKALEEIARSYYTDIKENLKSSIQSQVLSLFEFSFHTEFSSIESDTDHPTSPHAGEEHNTDLQTANVVLQTQIDRLRKAAVKSNI